MTTDYENLIRVVRFERPEWIPMDFHINAACRHAYPRDALLELMESHRRLFPKGAESPRYIQRDIQPWERAGGEYTDPWGCTWQTVEDGIAGVVTRSPLANWADFEGYQPPDPQTYFHFGPADWEEIAAGPRTPRSIGRLDNDGLPHGHTFQRLGYIRGYENLIFDMADDDPRLGRLVAMLEEFNAAVVERFIKLGAKWMGYPEDLGMQCGPMVSPEHFRRFIKPSYKRLMAPARRAGCIVHVHSDGDIRALAEDILDCGVDIINLQDLVNGIDWIEEYIAGRVCIDLDIDRQKVTRFGTPGDIDALIREEVQKLGRREGGLMMIYGLYPGVPLENIKALMDAMERYSTYYS